MYCNSYDLINRFGSTELIQRTDRTGSDVIDDAVLDQAISDASAEIDAYLSGFPLPSTSTVLVGIACDIARYRLYDDQILYSEMGRPISQVAVRYERWIAYLKDVAEGKIKLSPDPEGEPISSADLPIIEASPRLFGR
jgi:phage gp36-like protein